MELQDWWERKNRTSKSDLWRGCLSGRSQTQRRKNKESFTDCSFEKKDLHFCLKTERIRADPEPVYFVEYRAEHSE